MQIDSFSAKLSPPFLSVRVLLSCGVKLFNFKVERKLQKENWVWKLWDVTLEVLQISLNLFVCLSTLLSSIFRHLIATIYCWYHSHEPSAAILLIHTCVWKAILPCLLKDFSPTINRQSLRSEQRRKGNSNVCCWFLYLKLLSLNTRYTTMSRVYKSKHCRLMIENPFHHLYNFFSSAGAF